MEAATLWLLRGGRAPCALPRRGSANDCDAENMQVQQSTRASSVKCGHRSVHARNNKELPFKSGSFWKLFDDSGICLRRIEVPYLGIVRLPAAVDFRFQERK